MQSVFVFFGLIIGGLLLQAAASVTAAHNQPCSSNSGHQAFDIHPALNQYNQQQQQVIQTNSFGQSYSEAGPQKSSFIGPFYLPPTDHSGQYSGPEYLPPHVSKTGGHLQQQQQLHHPSVNPYQFQGPEYLPPIKGNEQQPQQQHHQHHQQQSFIHEGQQSQQRAIIQQQEYQEQGFIQQQGHQPRPEQVGVHQGQSQQHEVHQDQHQKFQQQQQHQQQQQQQQFQPQLPETKSFTSPDYLPPLIGSTEDRQQHSTFPTTFGGPDYLPPLASGAVGVSKGSEHLPLVNNIVQAVSGSADQRVKQTSTQQQQQQQHDQNISTALGFISLPTGYEFDKPDEAKAKEAFLQLHSLQLEQQKQQQLKQQKQQQQQQNSEQQLQVEKARYLSHQLEYHQQQRPQLKLVNQDSDNNNHSSNIYKANNNNNNIAKEAIYSGYQTSFQGQSNSQSALVGQQQHDQQHLQQPAQQHSTLQRALEYLPPVATSASSSQQQPLHQQNLRIVSAAPIQTVYSHPSTSHSTPVQVAPPLPPATGPQKYAGPATSYRASSVPQINTKYTLKSSDIQTHDGNVRQSFNTKGIQYQTQQQQQQQVAVAPPHGDTGKIRTVQILESKALKKTLKVLETADAAGVTTLKILGPSNEDPMGDHQVVRVVSTNGGGNNYRHDQQVQTIKIFNDHKVVTFDALRKPSVAVGGGAVNNEYLPPTNNGRSYRYH